MTPEQFETEGRGDAWVQRGRLMVRPQGQTYSPNYPKQPTPGDGRLTQLGNWAVDSPNYPKQPTAKAGDRVVGRPNGEGVECNTNDCWRLQPQPISVNGLRSVNGQPQPISGSTVLRLLGVSASLCLTAVDGGAISPSNLTVDLCATSATTQEFVTTTQEFVTNHNSGIRHDQPHGGHGCKSHSCKSHGCKPHSCKPHGCKCGRHSGGHQACPIGAVRDCCRCELSRLSCGTPNMQPVAGGTPSLGVWGEWTALRHVVQFTVLACGRAVADVVANETSLKL